MSITLHLRPREVLEQVITTQSGDLCAKCDRPIIEGRFHWLDASGAPVHSLFGGDVESFHSWRHADGTPGHGDGQTVQPKPRCPDCGGFELAYRETGYGSDTTCGDCRRSRYYDRGD